MIQMVLPYLQALLTFGNICALGYVFVKFLGKPHSTLEQRVTALEVEQKDMKQSLREGNDKFREHEEEFKKQKKMNKAFKTINLSFDFFAVFCKQMNCDHLIQTLLAELRITCICLLLTGQSADKCINICIGNVYTVDSC